MLSTGGFVKAAIVYSFVSGSVQVVDRVPVCPSQTRPYTHDDTTEVSGVRKETRRGIYDEQGETETPSCNGKSSRTQPSEGFISLGVTQS